MEHVSHSTIYLSPCSTSVYLEGLEHCTVYIACHQLRIHNCLDCQFYVRVHSHPIIEDCSQLGFAPYDFEYPTLTQDLEVGLPTVLLSVDWN
jgi:tubulin-specific chaperone C